MQSSSLEILTRELLGCEIPERAEEVRDILKAAGWKSTGASRLVIGLWKKAVSGDVNAAKLIREMNGETMDGVGVGLNGNNGFGAFDVSVMSDDALRALLNGMETEADNQVDEADNAKSEIEFPPDKEKDNTENKKKSQDTYVVPW